MPVLINYCSRNKELSKELGPGPELVAVVCHLGQGQGQCGKRKGTCVM